MHMNKSYTSFLRKGVKNIKHTTDSHKYSRWAESKQTQIQFVCRNMKGEDENSDLPVAGRSWAGAAESHGRRWRPGDAAGPGRGSPASLSVCPGAGPSRPACWPSAARSASLGPRRCSESRAGSAPCPRWWWASPHTSSWRCTSLEMTRRQSGSVTHEK